MITNARQEDEDKLTKRQNGGTTSNVDDKVRAKSVPLLFFADVAKLREASKLLLGLEPRQVQGQADVQAKEKEATKGGSP